MHRICILETYPAAIHTSSSFLETRVPDYPGYTSVRSNFGVAVPVHSSMADAAALQSSPAPNDPSPSTMMVYAYSSSAHSLLNTYMADIQPLSSGLPTFSKCGRDFRQRSIYGISSMRQYQHSEMFRELFPADTFRFI